MIRENAQGLLFSREKVKKSKTGEKLLQRSFTYYENKIKSLVELVFKEANKRRKILNLFIKGNVWRASV